MRYSTVFKFIAFVLCAVTLLGMVGSAAGIFFLTELNGKSVEEAYRDQLENQSIGYAMMAGEVYASETLGSANRNLINQRYGNDWESMFFNWNRVGYTLYDPDGKVIQEQEISGSRVAVHEFTLPVVGQYMKVIATTPREEFYPAETQPSASEGTQVTVMPSQEKTVIGAVYLSYTDGHYEEWPADGTQLGTLYYNGGSTVTFVSNIGYFPADDGWYPNAVLMHDMGGNTVYEAFGDADVILASELDGLIKIHLPAGTVTSAAPVGVTYTDGEYTSYDAIPIQGATVTTMSVTYANAQGETLGSEGVSSPDLIGTIFHDYQGNAEFHSTDAMTMDIPADCIITHITFSDAQENCIFEASCPGGVGSLTNDENGYLVFRGAMPGTVIDEAVPQETLPEEVEATEAPEEPAGLTGFARKKLNIYSAPSAQSKPVGTVDAWQELNIILQQTFDGQSWCLTTGGWILLENVLLAEDAPSMAAMQDAAAAEETVPEETTEELSEPVMARAGIVMPEETVSVPETEPEFLPDPSDSETLPALTEMPNTAAQTMAYPEEDVEKVIYFDSELRQDMVAQYVMESIPDGYTITIRLTKGALRSELGWTLLRLAEAFRSILLEALGICIAVFALCVVHLCCSAGRTRRTSEVRAGGLNRIPLDLYLAGGGFGIMGLVAAAVFGSEYFAKNDEQLAILFCGACAYAASLLLVAFCFAFVAQIKTPGGYWWRNTLCGRCLGLLVWCWKKLAIFFKKRCLPSAGSFFPWLRRSITLLFGNARKLVLWLWDTAKRLSVWLAAILRNIFSWTTEKLARFFGMLPITWQFLTTGFTLVFLLYVMMRTYKVGYILLGFGIFFAVILYAASAFAILLENTKRMSRGDLDSKVDDRMLIGGFKDFAQHLNDLAGVAVIAAQKQLKSERMKTELITNVSHDIKTPLTSIINYVDLLKKPHTEAQQEQYLEVLDRQSHRLKKLVDDLMEMSKASTGNLSVDIQRVDAGEAVNQALGEFADKLERAQLIPVFRQPDDPVCMMADGRLVWRVMSNLLSNAVKYALPGTRVYLDLMEMDGKVIISMKNISREELNIHADELLERFVRGDASRNTEGSGLGLNIAQSLMELQHGQLQILVDGDLFKVTLIFPGA